jgi:hypothetical protein
VGVEPFYEERKGKGRLMAATDFIAGLRSASAGTVASREAPQLVALK